MLDLIQHPVLYLKTGPASMTERNEPDLCTVDVLVYHAHPEKLSTHRDIRRPQTPNITVQPVNSWGKSSRDQP